MTRVSERPIDTRVMRELQARQLRDAVPVALTDQHRTQPNATVAKLAKLLIHDELRGQEVRTKEQHRGPRPGDRVAELRTPCLADDIALITPDLQPALLEKGLQHDRDPVPPLCVLAAVAHEHEPTVVRGIAPGAPKPTHLKRQRRQPRGHRHQAPIPPSPTKRPSASVTAALGSYLVPIAGTESTARLHSRLAESPHPLGLEL